MNCKTPTEIELASRWPDKTAEEIAEYQAYEIRRVEEIIKNRVLVYPHTMSPLGTIKVYMVMERQDYENVSTGVVFTDREKACAYIAAENIRSAITDPGALDNPFSIEEGEMR